MSEEEYRYLSEEVWRHALADPLFGEALKDGLADIEADRVAPRRHSFRDALAIAVMIAESNAKPAWDANHFVARADLLIAALPPDLIAYIDGRDDARRWRQNMHALGEALSHAATVHGYRCDCDRVTRTTEIIDFGDPPIS